MSLKLNNKKSLSLCTYINEWNIKIIKKTFSHNSIELKNRENIFEMINLFLINNSCAILMRVFHREGIVVQGFCVSNVNGIKRVRERLHISITLLYETFLPQS